jgi:hypothetical protein
MNMTSESDMFRIVFVGDPSDIGSLADMLRDEGLEATYPAPMERHGIHYEPQVVRVVLLVGKGALGGVGAAAAKAIISRTVEKFNRRKNESRSHAEFPEENGDI